MKEEDKKLLLIDLCARLPYGVKVSLNKNNIGDLTAVYPFDGCVIIENLKNKIPITDFYSSDYGRFTIEEGEVKPYLRPMSSMTEEEKQEMSDGSSIAFEPAMNGISGYCPETMAWSVYNVDYCISHHLDYRGLILMGLALEALEGMYKIK